MRMIISVFTKESRYKKIKKNKNIIYIIVLILIFIDQVVKLIITKQIYNLSINIISGLLNITYIENTGMAFSMGNLIPSIIINIITIVFIVILIVYNNKKMKLTTLLSLILVLAGGISNLIDRIIRGYVIDYIDFNPIIKSPIFNLADIFIFVGCTLFLIMLSKRYFVRNI